jgi:DNA-directed RNA polymerase subunit RPC12/RpoP
MSRRDKYKLEHRKDFTIGQMYTDAPCRTIICNKCGADKFIVGKDDYYTAIKCPNCGWELCIHEG